MIYKYNHDKIILITIIVIVRTQNMAIGLNL